MLRYSVFVVLLGLIALPAYSFSQEGQEAAKKSSYERLLDTPGSIVLAKKHPVGDPKFGLAATVSYRIDAQSDRFYTIDSGNSLSVDLDKLPKLISDLELFTTRMKAADGKDGENVFFRYSDKFTVNFYSFTDERGRQQQALLFHPGRFEGQGKGTDKTLAEFIDALKAGLTKLQDLKKQAQ